MREKKGKKKEDMEGVMRQGRQSGKVFKMSKGPVERKGKMG